MRTPQIVVAGHICLDIIPTFEPSPDGSSPPLEPGRLVNVGRALAATGGVVANAGVALHRLGVPVRLVGKIGNDLFGRAVLDILRRQGRSLTDGMIVSNRCGTSYTVVVNPPGVDRMFLHWPGANNSFDAADLTDGRLGEARLLHFGYPPLMRRMFARGGSELAALLARAKRNGLTTSLDVTLPDSGSPSGRVNWPGLLRTVLPHVDVFAPSFDETLFMLHRAQFDAQRASPRGLCPRPQLLARLAGELLAMGAAVVAIKLGSHGLYVRSATAARVGDMGACTPPVRSWSDRELIAPCFRVHVAGTTGAGDCTVAGFLASLVKGLTIEQAATFAVAVGACSVERPDATGGVLSWGRTGARIRAGWPRRAMQLEHPGWRHDRQTGLWFGPGDGAAPIA